MKSVRAFVASFFVREAIPFALSGAALAGASLWPETAVSLCCGILTAFFLVYGLERSVTPLRHGFLSGFVFTFIAFYWLPDTLSLFGGFPAVVSWAIYALFCLTSALQFLVVAWLWKRLRGSFLDGICLALPLAWMFSEICFPRLFPWAVGHSLIAWPEFAALGAYVGVPLCSVLVLWWGTLLYRIAFPPLYMKRGVAALLLFAVSTLLFSIGLQRFNFVAEEIAGAVQLKVALIQGNLDVKDKGDVRLLNANIDRYRALTDKAVAEGAELVLWPESVSNYWTPEQLPSVRNTRYDPYPPGGVALLYGGLSFRERDKEEYDSLIFNNPSLNNPTWRELLKFHRFNSVFGIDSAGQVMGRYHKRVLMPFGEYVPFSSQFPKLKTLLMQSGDFSPGDLDEPILFPELRKTHKGEELIPSVASLICYEDLIPSLSRDAVKKGAHLLVNQSNDAWYGDTAEPYQHHLLAQWRAIESARTLVRVTNTGFTAVVDAHGRTREFLPLYVDDFIVADVPLLSGETLYSAIGNQPAWILAMLSFFFGLFRSRAKDKVE